MYDKRLHSPCITYPLFSCMGFISAMILYGCQGNPQNGLEPVNTGIRSSPANSETRPSPGTPSSSQDIKDCHTSAATATSGPDAVLESRKDPTIGETENQIRSFNGPFNSACSNEEHQRGES